MSYLTPPRFSFLGNIYANASTATNNDIADVFDVDNITLKPQMGLMPNATTVVTPKLNDVAPPNPFLWTGSQDNPKLRNWLMSEMKVPYDSNSSDNELNEDVANAFAQAQMAHWNYYGDHNTEFRNTQITGIQLEGGPAPKDDLAYGLKVELLGDVFYQMRRGAVLVDVDPYALVTSQIFAGQFKLSQVFPNGKKLPVVIGDHPTVAYSYYINPHKNVNPSCSGFEAVSAIFQFAIPNDNLYFDEAQFKVSPSLKALKKQADSGQGLMVRYCLYDAIFDIQSTDLAADFAAGNYTFNPYEGKVIGSIGVWNKDELASAPPGRKFKYQYQYTYTPPTPDHPPDQSTGRKQKSATLAKYNKKTAVAAATSNDSCTKKATLGQTLAVVDATRNVISLDCISTFPEQTTGVINGKTTDTRTKFDFGPMNLVLLYGQPTTPGAIPPNAVTIGTITSDMYAQAAYETGGGVIDISYANNSNLNIINANLTTGLLAIGPANPPANSPAYYLIETPYLDVQTDDRAKYFDAQMISNGQATPGTAKIHLRVTQNGLPPKNPVTLNLEYWMCSKTLVNPDKYQVPVTDRYFTVEGATQIKPTPYPSIFNGGPPPCWNGEAPPCPPTPSPPPTPPTNYSIMTDQVTVPAGGKLTLNLTALRPGVSMIRFVDPAQAPLPNPAPSMWLTSPPMPNFGWDNVDYAVVRVLPFDDFSKVPDETINNWQYIYDNVLGFYSVMYPVMSKIIPWGPQGAPNNPQEVKAFASNILNFTDPDMWDTTIYMPITRDMSGGKRELLRRWCNLQQ